MPTVLSPAFIGTALLTISFPQVVMSLTLELIYSPLLASSSNERYSDTSILPALVIKVLSAFKIPMFSISPIGLKDSNIIS